MVCSEVPHSQAVSPVSAYSPIYSVGFTCGPYPCGGLLRDFHSFHSDLWPDANCSGLAALNRCCYAIRCSSHNVALLFEEAVTVAGLHEISSSLISGGLELVGGYDRDGKCHQLASCVQSCGLLELRT